jgi:hypothetical protein
MGRPTSLEKLRRKQVHGLRESIARIEKELHDPSTPGSRISSLSRNYAALIHLLLRYETVPTPMPEPYALQPKRGRGRPYSSIPRKVVRGDNGSLWAVYRRFGRDILIEVPDSRDMSPTHLSKAWVSRVTLPQLEREIERLGLGRAAASALGAPAPAATLECGCPASGCDGHLECGCSKSRGHRRECSEFVDLLG